MSNNTQAYIPCTLDTCPISWSTIGYQPNLCGNALFLAIFAVALFVQLAIGVRYKTWSYLVGMGGGLVLEIVGYAGRIQLHVNPFVFNSFIQYLVCLTIAPAFMSAVVYICFYRIIIVYDSSLSRIKPRAFVVTFIASDVLCLILQAAGGAITATTGGSSDGAEAMRNTGVNVMIAGLALQVVSLVFFLACALDYTYRVSQKGFFPATAAMQSRRWKGFLISLTIATIAIFIRSVFRVAELRDGFSSELAGNEVAFMILEGAMIVVATICLTVFHPGYCLGVSWKVST
ncbi:Efflux pump himE [Penicillium daleae]|uniref:Efflux pump himE n=1 Tax=Penicillium daleae TaxID=63821 RepID=A0AAD6CAX3_9EURO|nr:Efflux pump himE [Penicillium daleae]KAJ5456146.1 Efflux pump himE [Penicillium daleae]